MKAVWQPAVALIIGVPLAAAAQLPPIHPLGPVIVTSTVPLSGFQSVLRVLSDGRVLVNVWAKGQLLLIDSTLTKSEIVLGDGSASSTPYPSSISPSSAAAMARIGSPLATRGRPSPLIPYVGDTTLMIDLGSSSFMVIDPDGKAVRSIAVPRSSDLTELSASTSGVVGDGWNRLVYRTTLRQPIRQRMAGVTLESDTAPIIRADFTTRAPDTVGYIRIKPAPTAGRPLLTPIDTAPDGRRVLSMVFSPFELGDTWAVTSDGAVALVRYRDYHVDWIEADGRRHATPAIKWPWKRLDDDDKQRLVDSLSRQYTRLDSLMAAYRDSSGKPPTIISRTVAPAASDLPDYPPPFRPRETRADADGRIWIQETESLSGQSGVVYDIIDKSGGVVDRVQIPPSKTIVGFGRNGIVYLAGRFLERALVKPR